MISFVNGFLCTSSCDVAKAKRGVDPHPKTGGLPDAGKPDASKSGAATLDGDAVVFGGSLSPKSAAAAVQPVSAVQSAGPAGVFGRGQAVDLLA
ncbi:MAG: hypothetical protein R3D62_18880 [Xanthobacteraceae bacterium]